MRAVMIAALVFVVLIGGAALTWGTPERKPTPPPTKPFLMSQPEFDAIKKGEPWVVIHSLFPSLKGDEPQDGLTAIRGDTGAHYVIRWRCLEWENDSDAPVCVDNDNAYQVQSKEAYTP